MNKYFNVKNFFIAICIALVIVVLILILKSCGAK